MQYVIRDIFIVVTAIAMIAILICSIWYLTKRPTKYPWGLMLTLFLSAVLVRWGTHPPSSALQSSADQLAALHFLNYAGDFVTCCLAAWGIGSIVAYLWNLNKQS